MTEINIIDAYDRNADEYDKIFSTYKTKIADIKRSIDLVSVDTPTILEIGCGSGIDARQIIDIVGPNNYVGIDGSSKLIKIARKRNPEGLFHVKNLLENEWGVEGEGFDIVFAFYALLHMKQSELLYVLEKIHNLLKKGGIIYISSKYGTHKETVIKNFNSYKKYYSYTPEEIEGWVAGRYKTLSKMILDTDYGPSFVIVLQKN